MAALSMLMSVERTLMPWSSQYSKENIQIDVIFRIRIRMSFIGQVSGAWGRRSWEFLKTQNFVPKRERHLTADRKQGAEHTINRQN